MKVRERLRRWWKPGEYDDERRTSTGDGHPLTAREREEAEPFIFEDIRGRYSRTDPEVDLRPPDH